MGQEQSTFESPSNIPSTQFSSQKSTTKMGPQSGSGQYTQKQKVGVLEEDISSIKRSSTFSSRRKSLGTYRKPNLQSDQFQNRVDILENLVVQYEKENYYSKIRKNERIQDQVRLFEQKFVQALTKQQCESQRAYKTGSIKSSPLKPAEDEENPLLSPMTLMPRRSSRNGPGRLNSAKSPKSVLSQFQKVLILSQKDDQIFHKIKKVDSSHEILMLIAETLQADEDQFCLFKTSNKNCFGESNKLLQNYIGSLNLRNQSIFENIDEDEENSSGEKISITPFNERISSQQQIRPMTGQLLQSSMAYSQSIGAIRPHSTQQKYINFAKTFRGGQDSKTNNVEQLTLSGTKSPSYMLHKKSTDQIFVQKSRQQEIFSRPQSQLEPSNQQSIEKIQLAPMSYRMPANESPARRIEGSMIGAKKYSLPNNVSSKNIKIINSTKPTRHHEKSQEVKRWSVKQQKIVTVKPTPISTPKPKERPGNFQMQNKLQLTNAYKKSTEKKPNPMQRFQDDVIMKDMMKPKKLDQRMMSPKKQMIDLSQITKKDGRINHDQINANHALEEIYKSSSKIMPQGQLSQEKKFQRNYYINTQKQTFREIYLSDEALLHLIQYLGMHYVVICQRFSRNWYCRIQKLLNNFCAPMEKQFQHKYDDYLKLIKTKVVVTPTQFGNIKGIRIDRILEIQLKDSYDVKRNSGMTLKLENAYKYRDWDMYGNRIRQNKPSRQNSVVFRPAGRQETQMKSQEIVYNNIYRLDLIKSSNLSRQTWIHISDTLPGYAQNEIQVAPNDRFQIAFCIYNLNGFVDMETLQWNRPQLVKVDENMVNFLEYNRDKQIQKIIIKQNSKQIRHLKIICDIDRICDVEDQVYDWMKYEPQVYPIQLQTMQIPIQITQNLLEYFEVLETFYNESDQHYNKKILRAVKPSFDKRPGSVTNFSLVLHFDENRRFSLSILPREAPIINEIRRRGVISDRNKTEEEIQIRVGDILSIYETKHIPTEQQKTTNLGDLE